MYSVGVNGSPSSGLSYQLHSTGLWYLVYTVSNGTKRFFLDMLTHKMIDTLLLALTFDNTTQLLKAYFDGGYVGQTTIDSAGAPAYPSCNSQNFVKINSGGSSPLLPCCSLQSSIKF